MMTNKRIKIHLPSIAHVFQLHHEVCASPEDGRADDWNSVEVSRPPSHTTPLPAQIATNYNQGRGIACLNHQLTYYNKIYK